MSTFNSCLWGENINLTKWNRADELSGIKIWWSSGTEAKQESSLRFLFRGCHWLSIEEGHQVILRRINQSTVGSWETS